MSKLFYFVILFCLFRSILTDFIDSDSYEQDYSGSLDFSIDPCLNFSNFVCNRWKGQRADARDEWENAFDLNGQFLRNLLLGIDPQSKNFAKFRPLIDFLTACEREVDEEKEMEFLSQIVFPGQRQIINSRKRIGGIDKDYQSFFKFLGTFKRNFGYAILFDSEPISIDEESLGQANALHLHPVKPAYSFDSGRVSKFFAKIGVLEIVGRSQTANGVEDVDQLLKFHSFLEQAYSEHFGEQESEYGFGAQRRFEAFSTENLDEILGHDYNKAAYWKTYLANLVGQNKPRNFNQSTAIFVSNSKSFFSFVDGALAEFDWRTIVLYTAYQIFDDLWLGVENLTSQKIYLCPTLLRKFYSIFGMKAVIILANRGHFDRWIDELNVLFQTLKLAIESSILSSGKTTSSQRLLALNRTRNFRQSIEIGVPKWLMWENYSNPYEFGYNRNLSFYDNLIRLMAENQRIKMRQFTFQESYHNGSAADYFPRAYYDHAKNKVKISAGFSLPPNFSGSSSPSSHSSTLNYAILGTTVGHEIMHGFTEKQANSIYANLTHRLTEQLARYCNSSQICSNFFGSHENSWKILDELAADAGGLKMAHRAWKLLFNKEIRDKELTKFNLTSDQLFFVAYGRKFCSNRSIDIDSHGPNNIRIDLAVANVPEFFDAFQCSKHFLGES